jgi:hypothetical protein
MILSSPTMDRARPHLFAILGLSILAGVFWFGHIQELPREYAESGEVDLASWSLAGSANFQDAENRYRSIYASCHPTSQEQLQAAPRVPLKDEIAQFPLEMSIRTVAKRLFPTQDYFQQYKLLNAWTLAIAALAYYGVLTRFIGAPWAFAIVALHITLVPLITVGRSSGRMAPMLTSFLIPIAVLFTLRLFRSPGLVASLAAGFAIALCFFNGMHSNPFILPALGVSLSMGAIQWALIKKQHFTTPLRKSLAETLKWVPVTILMVVIANMTLAIVSISFLGLGHREFFRGFLFLNEYAMGASGAAITSIDVGWNAILERFRVFFSGFFIEGFWYPASNHTEEFLVDKPLLGLPWAGAVVIGVASCLLRNRKDRILECLALSSIICIAGLVICSRELVLPRYLTGFLAAFPILAVLAAKRGLAFVEGCKTRKLVVTAACCLSLLLMADSYFKVFTGRYFETGGHTLALSGSGWRAHIPLLRQIKELEEPDNLQRTAVILDQGLDPAIAQLASGFEFGGIYRINQSLQSKDQFINFLNSLPSTIDRFYYFADHPIPISFDSTHQSMSLNLDPTRYPVDNLELFLPGLQPVAVSRLNGNSGIHATAYKLNLPLPPDRIESNPELTEKCVVTKLPQGADPGTGIPILHHRSHPGERLERYVGLRIQAAGADQFYFCLMLDGKPCFLRVATLPDNQSRLYLIDPLFVRPLRFEELPSHQKGTLIEGFTVRAREELSHRRKYP